MNQLHPLRLLPLGGLGEIGLNLMVVRWLDELYLIDGGVMFPDDGSGTEVILPDLAYLREHRAEIRAIIITHGHEDHIGALPYILPECTAPVFGPAFALGVLRARLHEVGFDDPGRLHVVRAGSRIQPATLGFEFVSVTHSIPDSLAVVMRTPIGTVVFTGDFKIDRNPIGRARFDRETFARLGDEGVLLLLSDSTNVERPGWSGTEAELAQNLDGIVGDWPGRVILCLFASNTDRLRTCHGLAREHGRAVALAGRSLHTYTRVAREAGDTAIPQDALIEVERLHQVPLDRQLLVATGSQGEPRSALYRASVRDHRHVDIGPDDLVIFSSRIIPGNERAVFRVVNNLARLGAHVLHERIAPVHVSGHAYHDELAELIGLVRPRFFVPIHGEYHFLVQHAALARRLGAAQATVIENGQELGVSEHGLHVLGERACRPYYRDGLITADAEALALPERQRLAAQGLVSALLRVQRRRSGLAVRPSLTAAGTYADEGQVLDEAAAALVGGLTDLPERTPASEIQAAAEVVLRRHFRRTLGKRPVVRIFVEETAGP